MNYAEESLKKHYEWRGKLSITPKMHVNTKEDLSLAYTPGVAQPCLEIQKDPSKSYELTRRWNTVAVVTDGTAVLGLGDIGPEAGMPVMEGKCVLFKEFGGVDAIPAVHQEQGRGRDRPHRATCSPAASAASIWRTSPRPAALRSERRLKESCDIPVFHDDQHGTAVVALAALINALKVVGKKIEDVKMVVLRRGRGRHRHHQAAHGPGAQERHHVRPAGRHLRRHGGPERPPRPRWPR